ncbi:MAG: hypothetical protein ACC658_16595, partial [Acidimicrobiia bacterium]
GFCRRPAIGFSTCFVRHVTVSIPVTSYALSVGANSVWRPTACSPGEFASLPPSNTQVPQKPWFITSSIEA